MISMLDSKFTLPSLETLASISIVVGMRTVVILTNGVTLVRRTGQDRNAAEPRERRHLQTGLRHHRTVLLRRCNVFRCLYAKAGSPMATR